MTSFISYINNTVIKLTIYFNLHMRIAYRRSSRNQFYNLWVESTGAGNHNLPHSSRTRCRISQSMCCVHITVDFQMYMMTYMCLVMYMYLAIFISMLKYDCMALISCFCVTFCCSVVLCLSLASIFKHESVSSLSQSLENILIPYVGVWYNVEDIERRQIRWKMQ